MIIADTCLIFHLFNQTPLTHKAQEVLKKDPHWLFPSLWREEYANVLSKLARKEERLSHNISHHFDYTVNELKDFEVIVDTKNALEISIKYHITVYDAHFIALAIDLNTLLVTEDKEIIKKCSKLASNFNDFLKN